jgi:hypothetical protein
MDAWLTQRLADEHRRDLAAQFTAVHTRPAHGGRRQRPTRARAARPAEARSVAARPVGIVVGTWLIRAGTRLGGGAVRTS